MSSSLLQVVNNLFQTCYNKLGTNSANTTCEQTCNNLCVFMCVVQSLIGSERVYQCVVNKQLKTIVANKSNEKLANKTLETMKGGKNSHVK